MTGAQGVQCGERTVEEGVECGVARYGAGLERDFLVAGVVDYGLDLLGDGLISILFSDSK